MSKKFLSMLLTFAMIFSLVPFIGTEEVHAAKDIVPTLAGKQNKEPSIVSVGGLNVLIPYGVDKPNGVDKNTPVTAVTNTDIPITLEDGWYVVNEDVFIEVPVTVSGSGVNLILCDDCSLIVNNYNIDELAGIHVSTGNSLTIYAGSSNANIDGSGYLGVCGGGNAAGIGGDNTDPDSGTIIINGGKIEAYGGYHAAAIGGGYQGDGGIVTVNGGNLYAFGNENVAIGCGVDAEQINSTLNISKTNNLKAYAFCDGWAISPESDDIQDPYIIWDLLRQNAYNLDIYYDSCDIHVFICEDNLFDWYVNGISTYTDGTKEDGFFEIKNGKELESLAFLVNNQICMSEYNSFTSLDEYADPDPYDDKYVPLTVYLSLDFDNSDYPLTTPIGLNYTCPFCAIFNGGGKTVYLNIQELQSDDTYAGMFGYTQNASISNVNTTGYVYTIANSEQSGDNATYVGGIVGYAYNSGVSSCESNAIITAAALSNGTSTYAGGIVGMVYGDNNGADNYNYSSIYSCTSDAKVYAVTKGEGNNDYLACAGGIAGSSCSNVLVYNCGSDAEVYAVTEIEGDTSGNNASFSGGLIGESLGIIRNSYYSGTTVSAISAKTSFAGGIIGYGYESDSYATDDERYAWFDNNIHDPNLYYDEYDKELYRYKLINCCSTLNPAASANSLTTVGGIAGYVAVPQSISGPSCYYISSNTTDNYYGVGMYYDHGSLVIVNVTDTQGDNPCSTVAITIDEAKNSALVNQLNAYSNVTSPLEYFYWTVDSNVNHGYPYFYPVAVTEYEGEVISTYPAIQNAISAIGYRKGATVKMISDCCENVIVDEYQDMTFDLDDHILSGYYKYGNMPKSPIINLGRLNLIDNSEDKTSKYFEENTTTGAYDIKIKESEIQPDTDYVVVTGGCITGGNGSWYQNDNNEFNNILLGGGILNTGVMTVSGINIIGNTIPKEFDVRSAGAGIANIPIAYFDYDISDLVITPNTGIMTIRDSNIIGNVNASNDSNVFGGGIYNAGTITIIGGSVTDNRVASPDDCTYCGDFYNTYFGNNDNNLRGAGIYNEGYMYFDSLSKTYKQKLGLITLGGNLVVESNKTSYASDSAFLLDPQWDDCESHILSYEEIEDNMVLNNATISLATGNDKPITDGSISMSVSISLSNDYPIIHRTDDEDDYHAHSCNTSNQYSYGSYGFGGIISRNAEGDYNDYSSCFELDEVYSVIKDSDYVSDYLVRYDTDTHEVKMMEQSYVMEAPSPAKNLNNKSQTLKKLLAKDDYYTSYASINYNIDNWDKTMFAGLAYYGQTLRDEGCIGGGLEYALGDEDGPTGEWSTDIPTGLNAGTYYVWYRSAGDSVLCYAPSECGPDDYVVVSIAQEASDVAPTVSKLDETIKEKKDGKITAVTDAMEYKLSTAPEGTPYTTIAGAEVANLAPGEYLVRYAATTGDPSPATTITIEEGDPLIAYFNSMGGSSVTPIEFGWHGSVSKPSDPVRSNSSLNGWYLDGVIFTFGTPTDIEKNITLDASYTLSKSATNEPTPINSEWTSVQVVGDDGVKGSGLDELATEIKAANATKSVKLVLSAEKISENTVGTTVLNAIKAKAENNNIDYLSIKLTKYIGNAATNITQATKIVETCIPFDEDNKTDINVIHYHDGAATLLTESENKEDQTFYIKDDYVHIFTKTFSTFAIEYRYISPVVTSTNASIKGKADGQIGGVNNEMEYKLEEDRDYIRIPVASGSSIENLSAGTYLVRFIASGAAVASTPTSVVIEDGDPLYVYFDSMGGSPVAPAEVSWHGTVSEPANPTRLNSSFGAWYLDGSKFAFNTATSIEEDLTLYAVYTLAESETGAETTIGTDNDNSTTTKIQVIGEDGVSAYGLENLAKGIKAENKNDNVKLVLSAEKIGENEISPAELNAIKNKAGNKSLSLLSISLTKYIGTNATGITEANKIVEVIVPFDTNKKTDISVIHYHDGVANLLTESESHEDQTFYIKDNYVHIFTTKFSTFAIEYNEETDNDYYYDLTGYHYISTTGTNNGWVSLSQYLAAKTTKVTITANPYPGYSLDTLTVKTASGIPLTVATEIEGEKYSFTMPDENVIIEATFASSRFVDVYITDYYYDAVMWADKMGVTTGVDATHFNPDGITSRAQMVTFLWRCAGSPEPTIKTITFTDVNAAQYYYQAVLWAYENGITNGVSETEFNPDGNLTRSQSVALLARYAGVKDNASGYTAKFSDVKKSDYFYNAVAWAYTKKITLGTGATTFSPYNDCTRSQTVTLIYRYFAQ